MSEEQQLEAAIKASLQDNSNRPRRKHPRTDSDEFISLSSGDEEDEEEERLSVSVMEHDGGSDRDTTDGLSKLHVEHTSHYSEAALSSTSTTNTCSTVSIGGCSTTSYTTVSEHLQSRKRKSLCNDGDEFTSPVRKMPRSGTANLHEDTCIQTAGSESSALDTVELKPKKGAVSSQRKGKQKAPSSTSIVTVEEKLQSGELQKVDVSQVVIRLPDGVRIQKAFLCNNPIMVSDQECYMYIVGYATTMTVFMYTCIVVVAQGSGYLQYVLP